MDSTNVARALKAYLQPRLRGLGFDGWRARTVWRHHPDRVELVQFPALGRHLANTLGGTAHSFTVNLGCYLLAIPSPMPSLPVSTRQGRLYPEEHYCHIRGRLLPGRAQSPSDHGIWHIDPDGRNLEASILEVWEQLKSRGTNWFAPLEDPHEVVRMVHEDMEELDGYWGFGNRPSPIRSYYTGYLALGQGEGALARRHLEDALGSGFFEAVRKRIEEDLRRLDAEGSVPS